MKKHNARSKRVANKKKAANRQKNETRSMNSINLTGFDPARIAYGHLTGIDKMYIGKTYTFGEVAAFAMGYDETNCPASAKTGTKDMVYIGNGVYTSIAKAKSMGISIR